MIDLLRGLSCLGVLLYHLRIDLWIGWWRITSYPQEYSEFAKIMAWLSVPAPFLGYAILLFFLISGFCIHYPNTVPDAKPCWIKYIKRRFWRIYPTYLIAVILSSVISYYCHIKWGDKTWDIERILRVMSFSQNYPPKNGQFLSNPSLWTIPLEIEFYLLYPFAFFILFKFGFIKLLTLSLVISVIGLYLSKVGMQWVSFTAIFLWPSWLLGAWISSLYRKNKFSELKPFSLVLPFFLFLILALASRLQNWDSWIQYSCWTAFMLFFLLRSLAVKKLLNLKVIFYSSSLLG